MNSPLDDARWDAVVARRPAPELAPFVFAVKTTGVYCLPGCASRPPRRENVRFFERPGDAEAAAFRACKRCTPNAVHDAAWPAIARALAVLDDADRAPSLAELAELSGYSRAQFHRTFVRLLGLTPKRYAALGRAERLCARLQGERRETLLDAALASGYGSPPAFAGAAALGMTAAAIRARGLGAGVRLGSRATSLGVVVAAVTERGVCAVELDEDEAAARTRIAARFSAARLETGGALDVVLAEIVRAIEAPGERARVPLDVAGTAFQRRVWDELSRVVSGTTVTYGELAARLGSPKSARAVANACAANTLAVIVPCHRAVRGDGASGGYRWGADRKARLLARERVT